MNVHRPTRVLAIGAHFDDVELGCGGSLLRWKEQGWEISVFTATHSGYADPEGNVIRSSDVARAEGVAAAKKMGAELYEGGFRTFEIEFGETLNAKVVEVIQSTEPDLVLTHWRNDAHHDHRALALSTLHASRHVPAVLMYRCNWYDGDEPFDPRYWVDISDTIEGKVELIETYASENGRTGGAWVDFARSQARLGGLKSGVAFAEGFEVVKWVEGLR